MAIEEYLSRLPDGWFVSDPELVDDFQRQLLAELPEGHLLKGVDVTVVAHRMTSDDILCWHTHEPHRFTVVHLAIIDGPHQDSDHPSIEVDGTFEDFLTYERRWNRA